MSIPQEWVSQETANYYTQAIVQVMEMDKERLSLAPNPDIAVKVHETYIALERLSNHIADWLRKRGFASWLHREMRIY